MKAHAQATPNYWKLQACIEEVTAVRHSPAGIAILDCVLTHTSEVIEAKSPRVVQARIKAVALGEVAHQLQQHGLGLQAVFNGFISTPSYTRSTRTSTVTFHIQSFAIPKQT